MSGKAKDIPIHSQYGALTVLSRAGSRTISNGAVAQWLCSCQCGSTKVIDGSSLRAGRSRSCGQCPCRLRPYEALYNIFTSRAADKTSTVTYEDFITYTNISDCHYCGGSVSWAMYSLGDTPTGHRYNLDRKDNALGYHKDNLVVCCWPCNNAKGSLLSYEEMVAVGNIRRIRSHMSITLNAAQINQLIVGGVTQETDGHAAVAGMSVDFVANTITFTVKKGTTAGANFTPGGIVMGNLSVTINTVTGAWTVDGSGQSGVIGGAGLTAVQNNMKTWRNQLETFANNQAIMPGTVVAW